jgi:hypothetical protein
MVILDVDHTIFFRSLGFSLSFGFCHWSFSSASLRSLRSLRLILLADENPEAAKTQRNDPKTRAPNFHHAARP